MMNPAELAEHRAKFPAGAARADAERARVAALLERMLPHEGRDLDQIEGLDQALVAELAKELCIDTDGVAWSITGRGRAILAWQDEQR